MTSASGNERALFNRRIGLLDRTGVLDDDLALRQHIQSSFAEIRSSPTTPLGPSQADMASLVDAAVH